jgi:hypothetical protein
MQGDPRLSLIHLLFEMRQASDNLLILLVKAGFKPAPQKE